MNETHSRGRRARKANERRRIVVRIALASLLVLVPLVGPHLYRAVQQWGTSTATIGFTETNNLSGTLPALVTVDDEGTIETVATCQPPSDGTGSSCTAPVRLRRGTHSVKVSVRHPDGRWTPQSEPTVINVQ